MKKIILVLSLLSTVEQCFSQGLEVELIARPALTSLRGNKIIKDNLDPTINFSAGTSLNIFLKNNSFINITILYDKKGGYGKTTIEVIDEEHGQVTGETTFTNESNFNYITIPVRWGLRFGKKIKYQIECGPYTSFLLNQETNQSTMEGMITFNENNTNEFKALDLGISASVSVLLPLNDKFSVKLGIDDNLGLLNTSNVPVANNGTIKHNSLGLSVGLNYEIH